MCPPRPLISRCLVRTLGALGLVTLAAAGSAAQEEGEIVRPQRIRLFDEMERSYVEGVVGGAAESGEARTTRIGFESLDEVRLFLRRGNAWVDEPSAWVGLVEDGLEGSALQLGGDLPDRSSVTLVVPAQGLTRYRISGRVRLIDNPMASEASSREVLRVAEHPSELRSPPLVSGRARARLREHQVSRTLEPSGWDAFDLELLTDMSTHSLELHLLHRSGDSERARTCFDSIEIEETPVSEAALLDFVRGRYRPGDGRAEQTPWRSRVDLMLPGGARSETRDCLLLPAPARWTLPLHLPAAEDHPVLRFGWGMTPDAVRAPGDGMRLRVEFAEEGARPRLLHERTIEAKTQDRDRVWFDEIVDLESCAGRSGLLSFHALDVADSDPDPMDHLVISTPRIEPREAVPPVMNVVIIGCDTLRADRLSALGYDRDTTPNLRRLADAGIRFPRCRSQAPWTLPSFSSILTSLYPSVHGAGRGGHDEWTPIDPTTTSLAEILERSGYQTQGITANFLISPRYGLDQGFESYRVMGGRRWSMESVATDAPGAAEFVQQHGSTPYFLFWHIMDSHLPYDTASEFREKFTDPEYRGQFSGRRAQVPFQVLDPRPGRRWYAHEGPPPAPDLSEADRDFVHDYYDAEIAELDAGIGRVLDALEKSGQWDRTIVALVADHGEGLGDHGHYHHGYTLYDDQVHIPLLLRVPGVREGETIERPVASIDLAPTVLGALGLPIPEFFQGVDRLAADAPTDDPVMIEYPTYDSSAMKAYVRGRFKYLHDPLFHVQQLFDTDADPGETTDLVAQFPEFVAEARAALDEFRWTNLQKGRYHLRVHGTPGQRLKITVRTDDLFDANFVARPAPDEYDFTMNNARRFLHLDTTLTEAEMELVFWCRGRDLRFELSLDGEAPAAGLRFGNEEAGSAVAMRPASTVPRLDSAEVEAVLAQGAALWLESGVSQTLPIVPTPEEIERLRALGYAH